MLQSVVSDERLTSNREDLLGYPIHSHSELTLIENVNTAGQDAVQRPTGLVSETILINNVSLVPWCFLFLYEYSYSCMCHMLIF